MKLSDMTTKDMAEALCALTPPLCRIAQSPSVSQAIEAFCQGGEDHAPLMSTIGRMAEKLLPVLMREHLPDMCEILSVLTGKSVQALLAQPALTTLREARSLIDGELLDFFACAGSAAQKSC